MPALHESPQADGTLLLRSGLLEELGFQHAFSTSIGPDGEPFDLSSPGNSPLDSDPDHLRRNLATFVGHVAPGTSPATVHQVHGDVVVNIEAASGARADAIASTDPSRLAAIRTADCVPILLACRRRGAVAAIHAGWRGIVSDMPGAAVRHLLEAGSRPEDLVAAIGPAIGIDAFEIGPEVAEAFRAAGLESAVSRRVPRPHADLHHATQRRLIAAGVADIAIDGLPWCTSGDRRLFSHRRDRGRTGRQFAAIRCWHRAD